MSQRNKKRSNQQKPSGERKQMEVQTQATKENMAADAVKPPEPTESERKKLEEAEQMASLLQRRKALEAEVVEQSLLPESRRITSFSKLFELCAEYRKLNDHVHALSDSREREELGDDCC